MKKFLYLIAIAIVTSTATSYAQSYVKFGFMGGPTFHSYDTEFANGISPDNVSDYSQEVKAGYNIGAFVSIPLSLRLSLEPEAYYSQKSFKDVLTYNLSAPLKLEKNNIVRSIDVPILLNAVIADFTFAGKLYAVVGPSFSFLVDNDQSYSSNFETLFPSTAERDALKEAIRTDFTTINPRVQAGIGYDTGRIRLDVRYERNLANLSKNNFDMNINNIMVTATLSLTQ